MNYETLRRKMVEEQLIPRGISDARVLSALGKVERHAFIQPDLRDSAYQDHPLPIGEEQTISQPYIVAEMTQRLSLKGEERVLEIGTGSGYQAAILSCLAKEVYTIERIPALAEKAAHALKELGYNNVKTKVGDGTLGWSEYAPYDAIIVTAGAPKIPDAYIEQIKEGGRLIIPVGGRFSQVMTCAEKKSEGIAVSQVCGCVFVPLLGKDGWNE